MQDALATMRDAVLTASKARVMTFLLDEKLSAKARKGKIGSVFATMKKQRVEYETEITLHAAIDQQATTLLLV